MEMISPCSFWIGLSADENVWPRTLEGLLSCHSSDFQESIVKEDDLMEDELSDLQRASIHLLLVIPHDEALLKAVDDVEQLP